MAVRRVLSPRRTEGGRDIRLTRRAYAEFLRRTGTYRANALTSLLANPEYRSLVPAARVKILKQMYGQAREKARPQGSPECFPCRVFFLGGVIDGLRSHIVWCLARSALVKGRKVSGL